MIVIKLLFVYKVFLKVASDASIEEEGKMVLYNFDDFCIITDI